MSAIQGMNIEVVRHLGNQLQQTQAETIRSLMTEIDEVVRGTSEIWVGADATRFRSWWPEKAAALNGIAEDLKNYGQSALNNASEQEQASRR